MVCYTKSVNAYCFAGWSLSFFLLLGRWWEPPHVHVERDDGMAKFWLNPVRWQNSSGLKSSELKEIQALVEENQEHLLEAWNEYFNQ